MLNLSKIQKHDHHVINIRRSVFYKNSALSQRVCHSFAELSIVLSAAAMYMSRNSLYVSTFKNRCAKGWRPSCIISSSIYRCYQAGIAVFANQALPLDACVHRSTLFAAVSSQHLTACSLVEHCFLAILGQAVFSCNALLLS